MKDLCPWGAWILINQAFWQIARAGVIVTIWHFHLSLTEQGTALMNYYKRFQDIKVRSWKVYRGTANKTSYLGRTRCLYHVKEDELKQKCTITILIGGCCFGIIICFYYCFYYSCSGWFAFWRRRRCFFCLLYFVDVFLSTINDNS